MARRRWPRPTRTGESPGRARRRHAAGTNSAADPSRPSEQEALAVGAAMRQQIVHPLQHGRINRAFRCDDTDDSAHVVIRGLRVVLQRLIAAIFP